MGINAGKFVRGAVVSAIITGGAVVGLGLSPAGAATAPTFPGVQTIPTFGATAPAMVPASNFMNSSTNDAANAQAINNQLAKQSTSTSSLNAASQASVASQLQSAAANKAAVANHTTSIWAGFTF